MSVSRCTDAPYVYWILRLTIDVFIVPLLFVFGICGNTLSIITLGRDKTMKKTARSLLQMLALTDITFLTTCIFFQTLDTFYECTTLFPSLKVYLPFVMPYVWPVGSIAQTASVWIVVIVSADRYVAICKPLQAPQYCTTSLMRRAIVLVCVLSVLFNLPRFFEYTTTQQLVAGPDNTTILEYYSTKTQLRKNQMYFLVYKTCLFFIVRFCLIA